MYTNVVRRKDGSFVIDVNGLPYHVPNSGEWAKEWAKIDAYAKANPDNITEEKEYVPTLDESKAAKLSELNAAWLAAEADGKLDSSAVGVKIDATRRSNDDITGLIKRMEYSGDATTSFCAADNSMLDVSLTDLKTMQLEVVGLGQAIYARKWQLRAAIEAAQTKDELDAIKIDFSDVVPLPLPPGGWK